MLIWPTPAGGPSSTGGTPAPNRGASGADAIARGSSAPRTIRTDPEGAAGSPGPLRPAPGLPRSRRRGPRVSARNHARDPEPEGIGPEPIFDPEHEVDSEHPVGE